MSLHLTESKMITMDPQMTLKCNDCGSCNIVQCRLTSSPEADREPTLDLLPLSLEPDEKSVMVYMLQATDDSVSYFLARFAELIKKSCLNANGIMGHDYQKGQIYHLSEIDGRRSVPTDLTISKYTNRLNFVCEDPTSYRQVILQSLILGCRVRDYEQRLVTVTQASAELELRMPPQGRELYSVVLRPAIGKQFVRQVKSVRSEGDDRVWIVTCHASDVPLPEGVVKGSQLELLFDASGNPSVPPVTSALLYFSDLYNQPCRIDNFGLITRIYGEPGVVAHPAGAIARIRSNPVIKLHGGGEITLNEQQASAIALYNCFSVSAFVIEAPPGSGKTLTAAAMALSYRGEGVQLFLSTANVPVFNIAFALDSLDRGTRRPIHLISAHGAKKMNENPSPFSSLSLARKAAGIAEDDQPDPQLMEEIEFHPHDIYLSTVDTVLNRLFKENRMGYFNEDTVKLQLTNDVERVVVDEASQLTEAALNDLILHFPKAQIVLIGDSKQLPPFKYRPDDIVSQLCSRPAIDVVKAKNNLPVIELTRVYRASSSLIAHYSDVFYDGSLESCKEETDNPLRFLGVGAHRSVFWKVMNGQSENPSNSTSKINKAEIKSLKYIIKTLRNSGFAEDDVMIISYYEAQRRRAEESLTKGYEVLTVDSAQGREKPLVIVLTTRSSIPADPDEDFFNSAKRCNVATSRQQEALIVIGHPCIAEASNWSQVLKPKYFKHHEDNSAR